MKKFKIGLLGANSLLYAQRLASYFDFIELTSLFDTNKNNLQTAVSAAKADGIYLKPYNNADDFYATDFDMALACKNMYDYVYFKYTYLTDGICDIDTSLNSIGASHNNRLFIFSGSEWYAPELSDMPLENNLSYIKCGRDPLFAYFFINFLT